MVCRVCLKESKLQLQIFNANGVEQRIPEILEKHLWFTPTPNDPISKVVCLQCWCKLSEFNDFYETVKKAHTSYSEQYGLMPCSPEVNHPVDVLETVFTIKTEDTSDEIWTEHMTNDRPDNCDVQSEINPLYEPEVSNLIEVKSEEPESNNLEESNLNIQSVESGIENADECESNNDEKNDDNSKDDFDDASKQNDYETNSKKSEKQKILKSRKRARPSSTKPKTTKKTTKVAKKKSTNKKRKEQRCWSGPEDYEMVRKHLPLHCEICGFNVNSYQEIVKHFEAEHKGKQAYIFCCGRRLGKRQRVVQHAWFHEDPNYFQCEICKKSFSDHYVLRTHMLAHHPDEDELVHQCDECKKRFSRRYLLDLHIPVHIPVEERKFICPKCPTVNAFASAHFLKIHDSKQHRRATNVCHVCAKSIRYKPAFEKHMRQHFEDYGPRVKCPRPGCDRWLKDEENLKKHLSCHNDEGKIIKCEQCGKCVKSRRALSSHILYTHSTALFSCEECKKSFKKAITLKEHMAKHSGETLYKCPFCSRTFNSNANMHAHKKKKHPLEWDIWRKTKTGSAQSSKSNEQVI